MLGSKIQRDFARGLFVGGERDPCCAGHIACHIRGHCVHRTSLLWEGKTATLRQWLFLPFPLPDHPLSTSTLGCAHVCFQGSFWGVTHQYWVQTPPTPRHAYDYKSWWAHQPLCLEKSTVGSIIYTDKKDRWSVSFLLLLTCSWLALLP